MNPLPCSEKILNKAIEVAKTGPGVGIRNNYKLGAVLFNGKEILKAKSNSYKTHPLCLMFGKYPYLHAETHTCISHGLDRCSGLSLLVVRINSFGNLVMAKPCIHCERLLNYVGIKKVYYSDWMGEIQCL